jgi:hypothetical protein
MLANVAMTISTLGEVFDCGNCEGDDARLTCMNFRLFNASMVTSSMCSRCVEVSYSPDCGSFGGSTTCCIKYSIVAAEGCRPSQGAILVGLWLWTWSACDALKYSSLDNMVAAPTDSSGF